MNANNPQTTGREWTCSACGTPNLLTSVCEDCGSEGSLTLSTVTAPTPTSPIEPSTDLEKTDIGIILSEYMPGGWNGNMCEDLLVLFDRKLAHQQSQVLSELLDIPELQDEEEDRLFPNTAFAATVRNKLRYQVTEAIKLKIKEMDTRG